MTRRFARGDEGTTLAELAVTMLVFAVFSLALAAFTTRSLGLYRANGSRIEGGEQASRVMEQLSKDLRTAIEVGPPSSSQAFVEAKASDVTFYSSVTGGPVRERLWVGADGAVQRETVLPDAGSVGPAYTYATARGRVQRAVTPTGVVVKDTALFSYVLLDGTTVAATTALTNVVGVRLTLSLSADATGRSRNVVLENTVRPYNLT